MSISENAFISVDEIVSSILLKSEKPIHFYCKYLKLVADGVRELQLSHMPLVNHTILTKEEGETWFNLPQGFSDWVQVGIRVGEQWRPIAVSQFLMPYPKTAGQAEYGTDFDDEYNKGEWTDWLSRAYLTQYGQFSGSDFFKQDYLVDEQTTSEDECCQKEWPYRKDVVSFNPQLGVIVCPKHFPCNSLYLSYISIGNVDTMTHIPIQAQSTLEAYAEWKYEASKRNTSRGVLADYERIFYQQLRYLRARMNPLTSADIYFILNKYYGQQNYYSTLCEIKVNNDYGRSQSQSSSSSTVVTSSGLHAYPFVGNGLASQSFSTLINGSAFFTVVSIDMNSQTLTAIAGDFSQSGTTITLANGTLFNNGVLYYQ